MARAIIREPRVFLFDEPLSNLDAKLRVQMRHEIRRIHNRISATSVFVTHDQQEGMTLADRLVVMNKGVIEQVGTPSEIYDQPASTYVGGFIGSPAMNFLSGQVDRGTSSVKLANGDRIEISPALALRNHDKLVQIGVRPEAMTMVPAGTGTLNAAFEFVEELGGERLYHLTFEDLTLTVMSDERHVPAVGAMVGLRMPAAAVHVFDADTGKRVDAAALNPVEQVVHA
jgi:sn-glycerol 3-phosphate transport system ATP-binding protein